MLKVKLIAAGIVCFVGLIFFLALGHGLVGYNDTYSYQIYQSVSGNVDVISRPGYYYKGFGTVWTYPQQTETTFKGDQSIKVGFNDTGTAQVETYARIELPRTDKDRLALHNAFKTVENVKAAVHAHLINVLKASGPVMSASENQNSRKAEFNQIVEEQLVKGLYKMRRTVTTLDDLSEIVDAGVDANGNKITTEKKAQVQCTEVVYKDGAPIIIQPSPLIGYGLVIPQFSITEIEYDDKTKEQFAAKKTSYLNAELAKAQRQNEVQQRLMVEERGRRQVADVQAEQNQIKEKATIAAQQEADVAVIKKVQAVTEASQKVEVAEQAKKEAVMRAQQTVEVAEQAKREAEMFKQTASIKAERAELDKKAEISRAEGQQKAIELGGGITEKDRVLAEIKAGRDEKVASALATVKTPSVVIVGGDGEGSNGLTDNLINMRLLQGLGILEPVK